MFFVCGTRIIGDPEILLSTGHRPETMRVDLVVIIRFAAGARKCATYHDVPSYGNEASEYLADSMP